MRKKVAVTFAVSAVNDLEEIKAWYIEERVPDVGEQLLEEVLSRIETLAQFPESGRIVPEFNVAQLREIIYPPFRIVYRTEKERLRIVRIWRSERLMQLP